MIARNAKEHAAADTSVSDDDTTTEIILPENIPSLVGNIKNTVTSPASTPLVNEQPTKDLFGNPIVTTPVVVTPKPVIAESTEVTVPVVPELGDETLMSPAPEVGTWYKTGTDKDSLIEMLKKLKNR